jgi:hypothetical protein
MIGNAAGEIDRRLTVRPSCAAAVRSGVQLGEQEFYLADIVAACARPSSDGEPVALDRLYRYTGL